MVTDSKLMDQRRDTEAQSQNEMKKMFSVSLCLCVQIILIVLRRTPKMGSVGLNNSVNILYSFLNRIKEYL